MPITLATSILGDKNGPAKQIAHLAMALARQDFLSTLGGGNLCRILRLEVIEVHSLPSQYK